jgi:hypothetical protein
MGFYFKIAPGVKVRATRRGLRASVGPRAARVHFGAGGTGVSTGAGPVSLYHAVGSGRGRQGSNGPSRTSIAAQERRMRQAEKLQDAREMAAAFERILDLHREDFAAATAPVAPSAQPVDGAAIRRRHEEAAVRGLGVFQRSARAQARDRAAQAADSEINEETARRQQERASLQSQLDQQWDRLLANDPDMVFATLSEALEDNEAPAAIVGVQDAEVSVVVLAPDIGVVPERMPKVTDAGNLSFKGLTKSTRNGFYALLVCGHVLVTVREILAVAPAITSVRVAVVRASPPNAYGVRSMECLLAALFTRDALEGIQWESADSVAIVNDASAELRIKQGVAGELRPIDLSDEPGLAALLQAVDLEEDRTPAETGETAARLGHRPPQGGSEMAQLHDAPPPWRPRSGWGTIRDYAVVTSEHSGTDVKCQFVPDDGSEPVQLTFHGTPMPELGEYARGIMADGNRLTIKVPADGMIDAEKNVFGSVNKMKLAQRQQIYALGNDIHEDCGWAWTPDYKLVKAAPGLIE